jgi:magnesium-transporting ATPase (P-type)
LKQFANEGMRTLAVGFKIISEESYKEWNQKLTKANNEIFEREKKIVACYSEIESNFNLIGCTAIEDALQEGVSETLESLREAGIICWMITGDKQETAIQIGKSCKLIPKNDFMNIVIVKGTPEEIENILNSELEEKDFCLVIDGDHLPIVLEFFEELFVDVCKKCISVIACRMSPIQKGKIVELIKKHTGKRTLAIGDGQNDVQMIRVIIG